MAVGPPGNDQPDSSAPIPFPAVPLNETNVSPDGTVTVTCTFARIPLLVAALPVFVTVTR
jgi:hypothetical protein